MTEGAGVNPVDASPQSMYGLSLAKALKGAGFPQEGRGTRVPPPDKIVARSDDYAHVPTLEELIEALGSELGVTVRKT